MPIYSVHSRAADPLADVDKVRFVKEGFSWWGLFFPLFWLTLKGMWLVLIIAVAVEIFIMVLTVQAGWSGTTAQIAALMVNLIIGFEGYDLYRWTLKRRGLKQVGLTSGDNFDDAEFRYFASLPMLVRPEPQPPQATMRQDLPDPLGLFSPHGG
jgi:Protein of unknown function (DUF2628)